MWAIKHFWPYLYGHPCEVLTDYSALTSLLNTPQPSRKLAWWGMAIQELDIKIRHRPGRTNVNADALSRAPLDFEGTEIRREAPGVVAALEQDIDLSLMQKQDPDLAEMVTYLETGILPTDNSRGRQVALTSSQYVVEDQVLYRVEPDDSLRLIPPTSRRKHLFEEAHGGVFRAHLVKVYSKLCCHFWWYGMRTNISRWMPCL